MHIWMRIYSFTTFIIHAIPHSSILCSISIQKSKDRHRVWLRRTLGTVNPYGIINNRNILLCEYHYIHMYMQTYLQFTNWESFPANGNHTMNLHTTLSAAAKRTNFVYFHDFLLVLVQNYRTSNGVR